ncbi:hypothetical protein AB1Y20_019195 [Prymnesium parvum]|uniref:Uncharacterized protein n=1 Tax=Prymnesium parvum TaxID=97485 RepID=A0AB34JTM7_PRYPA
MTTGEIDVEALRSKYSGDRDQLRAEYDAAVSKKAASKAGRGTGAGPELPNPVLMCHACQAHGIVKKQYGYRVMDETCDRCGGEGMIIQKPRPASEELKAKMARVEALIGEADSLEELERLEAALKERTIEALESALASTNKQ